MRTALIVGAGGQDGTLLARLLHEKEYRVIGLDNHPRPNSSAITWDTADILQPGSAASLFERIRPDECYYLAAFHHSAEDRGLHTGDPVLFEQSYAVHVRGLLNCLEALAKSSPATRLFYAASSHAFGAPPVQPQTEATPFNPENIYAITKTAGVHCCRYFRRARNVFASAGILYNHESSLRPPDFLSQKIVRAALAARHAPETRLALGDLSAIVDWGYAPDYVEAMRRILAHSIADDFIIATGEPHTVKDFVQLAFEAVGLDWQKFVTVRPELLQKKPVVFIGDSRKLRQATGWKPTVSFREMVRLLVRQADTQTAA